MMAMRKCLIGLGFGVAMLMLLVGCGVASPAGADATLIETTEYVTTTTEETTEEPATAEPREWPGVPQAYWAILDNPYSTPWPASGFSLVDINNDGVLELVLLSRVGTEDGEYALVGLFTQQDGVAHGLAFGGNRFGFAITADGTIYTGNSIRDGQDTQMQSTSRLERHATELTPLTRTTLFWNEDGLWYRNAQGILREVTEEEYWEIIRRHDNPANPMQFNVTWFDE